MMIEITIPGYRKLKLDHLVMDYNGTLAADGKIIGGVKECLAALTENLQLHVITADTFGKVQSVLKDVACQLSILPVDNQDVGKLSYVKDLGFARTVCIGNGRNDRMMLKKAALGIAVILNEGACVESLLAADIVCTSIVSALELLIYPLRLTATLRS
jgi:soluble P-type ATPase